MAVIAHVGDIGNILKHIVTDPQTKVVIDVSGATTITFYLVDPSGNVATKTNGALSDDGTDGEIQYVLVADDIDEHGKWIIQSKVAQSTTPIIYNTQTELIVLPVVA